MAASLLSFTGVSVNQTFTGTHFVGPWFHSSTSDAVEGFIEMPFDAVLDNLYVGSASAGFANAGSGLGNTFTVRVNGVDTALTAFLPFSPVPSPYRASDLVHSVNVVAGDRVSVSYTLGSAVTSGAGRMTAAVRVTPTTGVRQPISFGFFGASPSTAVRLGFPYAGAFTNAAGTTEFKTMLPHAATLRNMRVGCVTSPTGINNITYTLRVNNVASALTVTIAQAAIPHSGADTTHTVAVVAGDWLSIAVQHSGLPLTNGSGYLISIEVEP